VLARHCLQGGLLQVSKIPNPLPKVRHKIHADGWLRLFENCDNNHDMGSFSATNETIDLSQFLKTMSLKPLLIVLLVILMCWAPNFHPNAQAANLDEGMHLFEVHCVGCHVKGGNIIRRGKNLKLKALERNKMDSLEAIAQIITNGKANMSAYQDRLTPEQIQDVAAYVLEQATQGWQ